MNKHPTCGLKRENDPTAAGSSKQSQRGGTEVDAGGQDGGGQEKLPESEERTPGRAPGGQLRYSTVHTQVLCGRRLDDMTRKTFLWF